MNLLCQETSKDKILEQYMAVIQQEKAKLKKQKTKKSKAESSSEESSSDSDLEVHLIKEIKNPQKHKLEEKSLEDYEKSEEEIAYLKKYISVMRLSPVPCLKIDMDSWVIA